MGEAVFKIIDLSKSFGSQQVLDKISDEEVVNYTKRKTRAFTKFLTSTNIGVMITKKSGQCQVQSPFDELFKLKEQFPDKKFYFLLADTFDFSELENFNFLDTTINTMCPRIEEDLFTLNIEDLKEFTN